MGFFDLFRKKKTDDELDLEEVTKRAKSSNAVAPAPIVPTMSLEDTRDEVVKMIMQDRKIPAIKYVKDNTGVGLAEAKAFVDSVEATCEKIQLQSPETQSQGFDGVSDELVKLVKNLLFEGRKMEAIKIVKDNSNWGLKECKDFVERLERK